MGTKPGRVDSVFAVLGLVWLGIASPATAGEYTVPYFLSAAHSERESFVRVINRSDVYGMVGIQPIDDDGWQPGALVLSMAPRQTAHFNSGDLEAGNVAKGITGAAGSPVKGDWRLDITTDLDIEVLAYVRTADGMLTSMLDTVADNGGKYRVPMLNPGKNTDQLSRLRVVNPGDETANLTLAGIDDTGQSPGTDVRFAVPAGAARSVTSAELESGTHSELDLEGALGTGVGKWRVTLTADRPVRVMSLLENPTAHITNLSTTLRDAAAEPGAGANLPHRVDVFPLAAHAERQGFVRIINHSDASGVVEIRAYDRSDREYPSVSLDLDANQAAQFNSADLENGNEEKGLSAGIGTGTGEWRLELRSELDIEVLAYLRTRDGFLTSVHDPVHSRALRHRVVTFNPGSNPNQVSRLRLINPGEQPVEATIQGIDDDGDIPRSRVQLTVPAHGVHEITAAELETGADGLTGALGDGSGKWQLTVSADRPIRLMSLLESPTGHLTNLSTRVPVELLAPVSDRYERYNDLEAKSWWWESAPYSCQPEQNPDSPWEKADMPDLGGSDTLSLIRYFGNGSYVRYGHMDLEGCTTMWKLPHRTHLDAPADPTYYASYGELDIYVDIARVPPDAEGWPSDTGERVDMTMADTVGLLNDHVAAYYRKLSGDQFEITFLEGEDFEVTGDGSEGQMNEHHRELLGWDCDDYPCNVSSSGAANRYLFIDVASAGGGGAWNGSVTLGLVRVRDEQMEALVHELGHAWLFWPHSYAEVMWRSRLRYTRIQINNPYSNRYDFMSSLEDADGWRQTIPSTLAINRYAAGWIKPEQVALHLSDDATYTLRKPRDGAYQFLVVHSGRRHAFTTLEVVDDRDPAFRDDRPLVYDPTAPGGRRPFNYEGVLVSRYDQTAGTGVNVRVGPAFYDRSNPDYLHDVGWARDDYALITDGESRDLGGGVIASVSSNGDGSYDVSIEGGRIAEFEPWCIPMWFRSKVEYDTGCFFDHPR